MPYWIVFVGLALATVLVLGGGYMFFFWPGAGARKLSAPKRDMRTTWKVVKLGEPVLEGMGLPDKIQYGVIISSDEMLAQTQTLLFCPLISGIDENTSSPTAILPWHVQVEIRQEAGKPIAELDFARKYVSTKIVLPIGSNEIDMDGLERGYLDEHSRVAVSKKLAVWLPQFARIAHY
jgi:hypothetical protein